jgi:hypothetical protein
MRLYLYAHFIFLFASISSAYAQKIQLYHTLDSLKKMEQHKMDSMLLGNVPHKTIVAFTEKYDDIISDIRDSAHDCSDDTIEHMDRSSHIELGLDMTSNQYYYGRRGPASGAEGNPALKYVNWTGLFGMFDADMYNLHYSLVRPLRHDTITTDKLEPDLTLTAGYEHLFFEKWDIEFYYDHTFIFYGTDKQLLSNTLDLNSSFDFWDYITAGFDYQFLFGGASTDGLKKKLSNVILFDLYKDFKIYRLPQSAVLSIGPEILTNVGNDNLARSRVIARGRHGGENVPELYDNFFGLLDVEGALNIDYRIKNLEVSFSPHIAIPFNEIPATLPVNLTEVSQLAQYRQNQMQAPIFYATVGIKYYFRFWKEQHKVSGYR